MKKFYFLFTVLLTLLGGAVTVQAEERTITVSSTTGEWTSANAAKTWAGQWTAWDEAPLTISHHGLANNMDYYDGTNIEFFDRWNSELSTSYIIEAEGWYIKKISFEFRCSEWNNAKNTQTDAPITATLNGEVSVTNESTVDFLPLEYNAPDETSSVTMTFTYEGSANAFGQTRNFVVVLQKMPEAGVALAEMMAVLEEYQGKKFMTGSEPGNYNADAVAAFNAAINAAYDLEGSPDFDLGSMSDEDLADLYRKCAQDIKDAYAAVIASRNMVYNIPDGYYRIKSALPFTLTDNGTSVYADGYLRNVVEGDYIDAVWGAPQNGVDSDCTSLWKITNKDGYLEVQNMATDSYFKRNYLYSSNGYLVTVEMSIEENNLMQFEPNVTLDGTTYFNIRLAPSASDNYQYDGVCYYCQYDPTSAMYDDENSYLYLYYALGDFNDNGEYELTETEWSLVPVDAAEAEKIIADYAPTKDAVMLKARYNVLLADAKANLEIAKDVKKVNLITSVDQLSSPYTEPNEGAIGNLIDGDASTFWHSIWSEGDAEPGVHYLQIELTESISEDVYLTYIRRNAASDQVTEFGVYGTNDPDAEKDACTELAVLSTPYGSAGETIITDPFSTQGFKYLRLYANTTSSERGYWHAAEIQLSYEINNEHSQAISLGELYTNLENVIKAQADTEADDITLEDYNTLKAAYDAFMEKFVDPTPLRNLLAELKGAADIVVVGDQPGFWASNESAGAFNSNYDAAVAYDASGVYTAEQSEQYIATLTAQSENIYASAKKVETGKWYRIRFGTEAEYETNGWSTNGGTGSGTNEDLFGKYLTSSYLDENNGVESYVDADELALGNNLFFDEEEHISDKDLALFRFVAVGDSAYVLQNKGTNLFLRATSGASYVTLDAHPSLFNVRAIGYGENVLAVKNLVTNASQNYLHAQVSYNALVTWNAYTPGSNSGFYIEEAGDVEADYAGDAFNVPAVEGKIAPYCFPVDITGVDTDNGQMYGVAVEGTTIKLFPIAEANAGRPFIYIYGFDTESYDPTNDPDNNSSAEYEYVTFKHGYTFVTGPDNGDGALKGTLEEIVLDRGEVYVKGNEFLVNRVSKNAPMDNCTIDANTAYISTESGFSYDAVLEIVIDEDMEDGIAGALASVAKSGAVYTIDGRLVSKKANVNDLQKFGKGVYILNGTKVVVK